EGFDAILLAAAGLHRIGWQDRISEYLSPERCVPAVGQGALGIECRADDEQMLTLLSMLNESVTARAVAAERSYLARLNGGCQVPIGAYATCANDQPDGRVQLTGIVGSPDGSVMLKETLSGDDPELIGNSLAELLLSQGADRI